MKLKIVFFMFIIASIYSCQRYKYPFEAKNPETASIQEGQKLYIHYCQKCHPNGEAGLGPSIFYLPGFAMKFQARHGLGVMPAFNEKVISDKELDKIVSYLKALDKAS